MTCTRPSWLEKQQLLVPCGKCVACRIQRTSEWSMRAIHELESHDKAVYCTLTYNDAEINNNAELSKEDLTKFFKRLRRYVEPRRIKYIAAGEYGETNTLRPHYHLIIFGVGLEDHKYKILNIDGKRQYRSYDGPINKAWKKGFITLGTVTYNSVRYTLEYMDKGQAYESYDEYYAKWKREPPFVTFSNGIGKDFAWKNKDRLEEELSIKLYGVERGIPRYYRKLKFNYRGQFEEKFLDIDPLDIHKKSVEKDLELKEYYENKFGIEKVRGEWIKHCIQKEKNLTAARRRRRGQV